MSKQMSKIEKGTLIVGLLLLLGGAFWPTKPREITFISMVVSPVMIVIGLIFLGALAWYRWSEIKKWLEHFRQALEK